jgi:hypothetical protein
MFNLFSPPCFAAIGAMRSEIKSKKWFFSGVGLQFAVGYSVGFLTFFFGTLLTGESFGDITCENGVYGELPAPEAREGYTFAGWFTKVNGGKRADEGAHLLEFEDHTLYAHFIPVNGGAEVKHKVTFDPDGTEVWVAQSTEATPVGTSVGLYIDPENIHIMRKSGWHKHSEEELEEEGMM